jgi:hypothetical protein
MPSVDDVADQIDRLSFVIADELEQPIGLAAFAAEVHVGDEQRAKPAFRRHGAAIPPVAIMFVVATLLAMMRSSCESSRCNA